jgi:quinol monooxygenase YgiN
VDWPANVGGGRCFDGRAVIMGEGGGIGMTSQELQRRRQTFMSTQDRCCSIVPYFQVSPGQLEAFKALCEQFVAKTQSEPGCLYYGFAFDGDQAHCREGYSNAEGVLAHLDNVGALLQESLKISTLIRLEIHGPEVELAKLRGPLSGLKPQFFVLEYGFRR